MSRPINEYVSDSGFLQSPPRVSSVPFTKSAIPFGSSKSSEISPFYLTSAGNLFTTIVGTSSSSTSQ